MQKACRGIERAGAERAQGWVEGGWSDVEEGKREIDFDNRGPAFKLAKFGAALCECEPNFKNEYLQLMAMLELKSLVNIFGR